MVPLDHQNFYKSIGLFHSTWGQLVITGAPVAKPTNPPTPAHTIGLELLNMLHEPTDFFYSFWSSVLVGMVPHWSSSHKSCRPLFQYPIGLEAVGPVDLHSPLSGGRWSFGLVACQSSGMLF